MYDYSDQYIRESIKKHGRMTFAEFMQTVLFSKNYGYYRSTDNITDLDYYTSPTTHPAFGAMLSLQLEQLWEVIGRPTPFYVIEIGSGSGILSNDILFYSRELNPRFQESLEYISVDYRSNLYANDHINLNPIKSNAVPFKNISGCILSNELLDAFPVHRFLVDGNNIKEIYIQINENGKIEEVIDNPSNRELENSLAQLGFDLPNGLRGEVNLTQLNWIEEVNSCLETGLVLTIDYGDIESKIYSSMNSRGTLRCYYRHTLVADPYIRLGMQDMTSLVNFTSLIRAGEFLGLKTAGFTTQRQFLSNLGFNAMLNNIRRSELPQNILDSNRMAILDLIKPTGMGNFKVLAQTKGLDNHLLLNGFNDKNPMADTSLSGYKIPKTPLLRSENPKLMEQRYPHLSWGWESMWPWEKH
jgi:SAM-dependent MidA family methyltransferase